MPDDGRCIVARDAVPLVRAAELRAVCVSKRFGALLALDGVSVSFAAGECAALVGASGAGKSTLLRLFNRLVEADAGTVTVDGVDVRTTDAVGLRRRIGYVPQDGGLLPHWTVGRNVELVPHLLAMADHTERAAFALERVGLPVAQFAGRWPHELSGGQRQRVAIARAIAAAPAILLMDEPFGALDAITRGELHELFEGIRREQSVTTLLVTHDLTEATRLADRLVVMRGGRVEQDDAAGAVVSDPRTPYVAELVARAGIGRVGKWRDL